MTSDPGALADRLMAGEALALARAISIVEDRLPGARELLAKIYPRSGRAPVVGVTGPPGAGKSTLVDALAVLYRAGGARVGIVAVDPSSAFSGGAVLGDRVRMQRHSTHEGVFIRSMATRGHFGGLAGATVDVVDLMDAAGCQVVIVETVGVGQDEVDVVRVADAVLVVLVPGLGDDVQTIKAGIMEIPDIFVLNKADRDGIDRLHTEVSSMLALPGGGASPRRSPPAVMRTVAVSGEGIADLHAAIGAFLKTAGTDVLAARRRERCRQRLLDLLRERVLEWAQDGSSTGSFERLVDQVADRAVDPYVAADILLQGFAASRRRPA